MLRHLVILLSASLCASAASAALKPAPLFTDHAVLQQDAPAPVWGTADPGEKITVKYAGQEKSATADAEGKWMVHLDKLAPGLSGSLTISGQTTIVLDDVITGEVWLCSGQSNMARTVTAARDPEKEIAAANYPSIRMFVTKESYQHSPQSTAEGTWLVCSPETAAQFSAVAYFFGRELHQTLKRPVGLIVSAVGGSKIELWISREGHEKLGTATKLEKATTGPKAAKAGSQLDRKNKARTFAVGGLYNGMIAPLIPYAIRGAIWYQGEANATHAKTPYHAYLTTLIADWRGRWADEFPFAWVQLPDIRPPQTLPVEETGWVLSRDSMLRALETPKTGMAVTLGLGDEKAKHPTNKQDVGKRLSLWALGDVYGEKVPATSGPLPQSHRIDGKQIEVTFTHTDGGLVAKGGTLQGFAIAGEDRKWHWADARIDGTRVIASSPEVPAPVALRYAWADNPKFTLFNAAGLPASPFRTDTFPVKRDPSQDPEPATDDDN